MRLQQLRTGTYMAVHGTVYIHICVHHVHVQYMYSTVQYMYSTVNTLMILKGGIQRQLM